MKCGVQIAMNTRSSYQSFPLALTHWDKQLLVTLCVVLHITDRLALWASIWDLKDGLVSKKK